MEKSQSIANLAKALAAFQGKVPAIKKDAKNPFFKSSYATLGNIIDTIKALLSECGLSYCQLPDGDESLTTILMHSESGEFVQATYSIHASKKDPQGVGSAITYARRYALSAILGLNTDDDDDGNGASGNGQQQAPKSTERTPEQKDVADAANAMTHIADPSKLEAWAKGQPEHVRKDKQFRAAYARRIEELAKSKPVAA